MDTPGSGPSNEPDWARLVDRAAKLLALTASLSLALSVAYDWSFLLALGLTFADVPTSISDHVRSGIVWAPTLFIAVSISFANLALMHKSDERLEASSRLPKLSNFSRNLSQLMLVLFAVTSFVLSPGETWLFPVALLGWLWFSAGLLRTGSFALQVSRTQYLCILLLPCLLIFNAGGGYLRGSALLAETTPRWNISVKDDKTIRPYLGIRRFSTVTILVGLDHKVRLLPSELIQEAVALPKNDLRQTNLCRWFGLKCATGP